MITGTTNYDDVAEVRCNLHHPPPNSRSISRILDCCCTGHLLYLGVIYAVERHSCCM